MFGTSGIRGIYGKDVTDALAYRVACAFADRPVAIGRDTRPSGRALFHALVAGVLNRGQRIIDMGIVPTPTVALATQKYRCRGIMITASHNPPEYQGLKLLEAGREISKSQEQEFERVLDVPLHAPAAIGSIETHDGIIADHIALIRSLVNEKSVSRKKPTVVVDCNGAGAAITPYALQALGARPVSVNAELSGFHRLPEPTAENLRSTCAIVRATGAAFGIAHDGDADRAIVIDETGELLGLDVQLALAIEQELEHAKNRLVLTTVEASLLVRETIERLGGRYEISPVGSVYLSDRVATRKAVFAGEPCGEYIYPQATLCPDGVLAAAKFAELFAAHGSFARQKKKFTIYPMLREKSACQNKSETMEKIKAELPIDGQRNEEDGVRVDEEDGWFLIRASGTEPIIRLTAEYKTQQKLNERAQRLRQLIATCSG